MIVGILLIEGCLRNASPWCWSTHLRLQCSCNPQSSWEKFGKMALVGGGYDDEIASVTVGFPNMRST